MVPLLRPFAAAILSVLSCVSFALADDLAAARSALAAHDYVRADTLAKRAIEAGTSVGAALGPSYEVEARASVALHDEDGARRAFVRLLAVEPDFRIEPDASDELRSPYLEARGFWADKPTRLHVRARASEDRSALVLQVSDPAEMAVRVRVRARTEAAGRFSALVQQPASELTLPIQGLQTSTRLEVQLALLDEHGNRIWQAGNDQEPLLILLPNEIRTAHAPASPIAAAPVIMHAERGRRRAPWLWGGSAVLLTGTAALVGAGFSHHARQDLASEWNRADCSGSGLTRAASCGSERSRLDRFERTAVALYGVGGLALVSGVVLLLLAPTRERAPTSEAPRSARAHSIATRTFGCGGGPGELGASCTLGF